VYVNGNDGLELVRKDDGPTVKLAPPNWAIRLRDAADAMRENRPCPHCDVKHRRVRILFDEATTAPPAVQAALLRVVWERAIGDLQLPPEVQILLIYNPPEEAAGGWSLEPPLANRMPHFEWPMNREEWAIGMVSGFPDPQPVVLPDDWQQYVPAWRAKIAEFIKRNSSQFYALPKDEEKRSGPWPSPRTWDITSKLLAAGEAYGLKRTDLEQMMAATVGAGAATMFIKWEKEIDLPLPEELLKDPDKIEKCKVCKDVGRKESQPIMHHDEERPDRTYAKLGTCTAVVIDHLQKKKTTYFKELWELMAKAADAGAQDVAASFVFPLMETVRDVGLQGKLAPIAMPYMKHFYTMLRKAGLMPEVK
jgi:hypothetical protein